MTADDIRAAGHRAEATPGWEDIGGLLVVIATHIDQGWTMPGGGIAMWAARVARRFPE